MPGLSRTAVLTILSLAVATPSLAQPEFAIRLKSRAFVPPARVERGGPPDDPREFRGGGTQTAGRRHVLIQFTRPVDPAMLQQLRRRGVRPLRYVPERTIAAAVPPGFDATSIEAIRWIGTLEPGDRLSRETVADLAAGAPSHPLTVVEFHADVTREEAASILADVGTYAVAPGRLPAHLAVIPTESHVIDNLSRHGAVAWIFPAGPGIVAVSPAGVCAGAVQPEGLVANFAGSGEGWDGPGRGTARLGFFLSRPSVDLSADVQQRELVRARSEWSRYAAVTWEDRSGPNTLRSIDVAWVPPEHGDGTPFAPEVLAHAFFPTPQASETLAGDIHFNEDYRWAAGDPTQVDVFSVALHELGHSLGLGHSGDPDAVMYPVYLGIVSRLSPFDIEAIRTLYAAAGADTLPGGWVSGVIGGDSSGGVAVEGGQITIVAGGQDIWGTSDEFRFVSRPLSGDGDIVARVGSLTGTHRWAKAGVMIRAGGSTGAAHGFALVSLDRGVAFQRRRTAGATSSHTDGGPGSAPVWLWLSRRGSRLIAFTATDGGEWRRIGEDSVSLPVEARAGLALTNHDVSGTARAVFSHVTLTFHQPDRWTGTDIGAVGRAGGWSGTSARLIARGAGADVWGTADAFHFVWQPVRGDFDIIARLGRVSFTHRWAKAGLMIRGGLHPSAAHGFMLGSAGRGYAFQRRRRSGELTLHTSGGEGEPPGWLRLSRRGQSLRAYRGSDGRTWTLVGAEVIGMPDEVLAGVAVTSHTTATLAEAVFEHVTIGRTAR